MPAERSTTIVSCRVQQPLYLTSQKSRPNKVKQTNSSILSHSFFSILSYSCNRSRQHGAALRPRAGSAAAPFQPRQYYPRQLLVRSSAAVTTTNKFASGTSTTSSLEMMSLQREESAVADPESAALSKTNTRTSALVTKVRMVNEVANYEQNYST